jgi:hypothetical protein
MTSEYSSRETKVLNTMHYTEPDGLKRFQEEESDTMGDWEEGVFIMKSRAWALD